MFCAKGATVANGSRKEKPEKPYPEFPLFPHATGRWAKKHGTTFHYFGPWRDPAGALKEYEKRWPYIVLGMEPPSAGEEGCTVADLCNQFMASKDELRKSNELSDYTRADYLSICQTIVDHFTRKMPLSRLTPADFERFRSKLAEGVSKITLKNRVNRARVVFNYAFENGLVSVPVKFGRGFDRPNEKSLRHAKNEAPERYIERTDLLSILGVADYQMRAMILLGLNCGFGNTDVASLPLSALDLDSGWVVFPRPKTGVLRRSPLWGETIEALKLVIKSRPKPIQMEDENLCFVTPQGNRWMRSFRSKRNSEKLTTVNTVSQNFSATARRAVVKRHGVSFYALRHVFETIGGESRDQVAVDFIMGHAPKSSDMASQYRHGISDSRLINVTDTIHRHMWPKF